MMRKKQIIRVMSVFLLTSVLMQQRISLDALIVGSDTTPSKQAFFTFPAIDSNNTILGFAAMNAGFALETASTTCTYTAFVPVSGPISLNGGTLTLLQDMIINDTATLTNLGNIVGNGYAISIPSSISLISTQTSATSFTFANLQLILSSRHSLQVPTRWAGTGAIIGDHTILDLRSTGSIIVTPGSSLLLKNLTIRGLRTGNLQCMDALGTITFDHVVLDLDQTYSFTTGKFDVLNDLIIRGTQTFVYASTAQSTIRDASMLLFDLGTTLSYDVTAAASRAGISLYGPKSVLFLRGADLYSSTTGMQLMKGKLLLDGRVDITSAATVPIQGILLGDGTSSANDVTVEMMPAANVVLRAGYLVYQNVAG